MAITTMRRTRIKICGVMRPEDAAMAAAAGADAIGMIFHGPARRNISIDQARRISAAAPPLVMTVGVFVNSDAATIQHIASAVGLGMVQLHGQETPQLVAELTAAGLRVIKAVAVDEKLAATLDQWRSAIAAGVALWGIVLETGGKGATGGSGIANDWPAIERLQLDGKLADLPPLIAAGGLYPDTVGDVVRLLRPWAVDVSSGVEVEPGNKSKEKVEAFIGAVRQADG